MMNTDDPPETPVVAALKQDLGHKVVDVSSPRERRVILASTPQSYREVIMYLKEKQGCNHLSLVNGVDVRTGFEVVYHFWSDNKLLFTLKVALPRDNPSIGTITDIVPAAILYEREVHDLFGIDFAGHPDMRRLMLSEDWPEGQYPLRKDWKLEKKPYCLIKAAEVGGKRV